MVGPLGALPVGPIVTTTEVEEDIDGGPPRAHCRRVWQQSPPRLKKMMMVGPLGSATGGSDNGH
jgi:hypothetical protein